MLPLEGIKVVDLTTWALAPACAATLGDWGADVIKIEDPETGDVFRWFLMAIGIDESQVPISLFGLDNRNKRGMAVDLKQPEGRDIVCKLVEDADIFVSNLPAESLRRLDLAYSHLSGINPRLIYAHASGFGDKGPDVKKPGFDATAYWARSGLMSGLAVGGQPPVFQQYAGIGDQVSGLVLFGGVLLALYNREKTGRGQQVDLSLLGVGTWVTSCPLQIALSLGQEPPRWPRDQITNAMVNYYKTKDDKWLMMVCLPDEPYWPPLCKAIGQEDLENDPKFSTREKRMENNVELIRLIDEAMATKTRDEWGTILDEHGIVWTHIPSSFEEVTKDPQVLANEHIVEVEHPSFGPTKIVTTPIRLNKETPPIRKLAPEIGQHNEEILLEMNYSWDDIGKLRDKGVIP
ncbi:MAG: CoA transferase [Desulfobacteraceae bacterium]|nr:CoA transferase [Desulfobacteraceae bacterium]